MTGSSHREWSGPVREARLKKEFAGHYPGLEPGVWLPAAGIADYVLARARIEHRPSDPSRRMLNPDHFDFRGETPRTGSTRTRATDT